MAIFGKPSQIPLGIADAQPIAAYAPTDLGDFNPKVSNSPFRQGGKGWQTLGIIGDALQVAGGGRATFADAQRWMQEQEAEQARRAQERDDRMNTPSILNTKAGVISATPTGDVRMLHAAPPEVPEWQQYVQAMSDPNTSPQERQYIQQYLLKGNAPDIMQQRLSNQVQLKTTAPGSSGGGGGGSSVPKGIFSVKSAADYARLPSGTKYTAPDGSVRIKQ